MAPEPQSGQGVGGVEAWDPDLLLPESLRTYVLSVPQFPHIYSKGS